MARPGWYVDNLHRAYPFVKGSVGRSGGSVGTASPAPIGYVTLADPSFRDPVHNIRGWATGSIFPGYDDAASLSARKTAWLDGVTNYFNDVVIPQCLATGCRGFVVHDGFNGQQYPHPVGYHADPRVYQPEAPEENVDTLYPLAIAAGLEIGVIVRPTVPDPGGVNVPPYGQPYEADPVLTVRNKIAHVAAKGGTLFYFDSSVRDVFETLFTVPDVQSWLAEFPGITIIFEWYNAAFAALPGVRALHQPVPGGYLRTGGMQETPEWDPEGNYWLSTTLDLVEDAGRVAYLSAAYARGAQLYLYVGTWPPDPSWAAKHAALWRAHYVPPAGVSPPASAVEGLPDDAVVDAGFLLGLNSGFVDGANRVYLDAVRRAGDDLFFDFTSEAPGLLGRTLTFARSVSSWTPFETEHASRDADPEPEPVSDSAALSECGDVQLGPSGTLVAPCTGRLRLYFNDDHYGDNSGKFTLAIAGDTYDVPSTAPEGVAGPWVHAGASYPYTASGTIEYRRPSYQGLAGPGGTLNETPRVANELCPCPDLQKWSLVGKVRGEPPVVAAAGGVCAAEPAWSGYLVTGDLSALIAAVPDGGVLLRAGGGGVVEPALAQNLAGSYVSSFNLANQDRTRIDSPAGCPPVVWPFATGEAELFVSGSCVRGDVRVKAGYNAVVRQDAGDNSITLAAEPGAGAGQPCGEPELFPGEGKAPASALRGGGPRCNDVVRSFNGVGGKFADLIAGFGVRVEARPAEAKVVVDVNMRQLAVCYSDPSQVSEGA